MTSPFGPIVVIANPQSGRGKVGKDLGEVERILRDEGLDYRVVRTTHPGHATEVARAALEGGERYLVAAGGDGTVHEVVNGMLQDGQPVAADAVLGVVASGSGCDFVKSFGLPGDAVQAAHHLAGDAVRYIDVGKVTFTVGAAQATRYFPNIAEAGLGGAVTARASRLPAFLGPARYFCGFWLTLPGFRPATVRLDADSQAFQWRAHNVVVANCRFYGGGMQISPRSEPDDGALDVLVMVRAQIRRFHHAAEGLPRDSPAPPQHRGAPAGRVRIDTDLPFRVEADGEILSTTPATFEVIRSPIRVKV